MVCVKGKPQHLVFRCPKGGRSFNFGNSAVENRRSPYLGRVWRVESGGRSGRGDSVEFGPCGGRSLPAESPHLRSIGSGVACHKARRWCNFGGWVWEVWRSGGGTLAGIPGKKVHAEKTVSSAGLSPAGAPRRIDTSSRRSSRKDERGPASSTSDAAGQREQGRRRRACRRRCPWWPTC